MFGLQNSMGAGTFERFNPNGHITRMPCHTPILNRTFGLAADSGFGILNKPV